MESHSVTCHPTQVNTPRLNPSQPGRCSIYLYPGGMEGWLIYSSLIAARSGIEHTTAWSQVRRPNRYATKRPWTTTMILVVILMQHFKWTMLSHASTMYTMIIMNELITELSLKVLLHVNFMHSQILLILEVNDWSWDTDYNIGNLESK